jgi:hypothetical protein
MRQVICGIGTSPHSLKEGAERFMALTCCVHLLETNPMAGTGRLTLFRSAAQILYAGQAVFHLFGAATGPLLTSHRRAASA